MKNGNLLVISLISIFLFSSCVPNENTQTSNSISETNIVSTIDTENTTSKNLENNKYMEIGKEKGLEFKESLWEYFGTYCNNRWKTDSKDTTHIDEYPARQYQRCLGLYNYNKNVSYTEMTFKEAKEFLIKTLNITENGFNDLCKKAPSGYAEINGYFYVGQGDGGEGGWDCSYIIDYTLGENDTVIYNCERIGFAGTFEDGYWGYDKDKIENFWFSLKQENGNWKFNDCSNYNAFFNYFIGFKNDYKKP